VVVGEENHHPFGNNHHPNRAQLSWVELELDVDEVEAEDNCILNNYSQKGKVFVYANQLQNPCIKKKIICVDGPFL